MKLPAASGGVSRGTGYSGKDEWSAHGKVLC